MALALDLQRHQHAFMRPSEDLVADQGRMDVCLLLDGCCLGWLWPVPTLFPVPPCTLPSLGI